MHSFTNSHLVKYMCIYIKCSCKYLKFWNKIGSWVFVSCVDSKFWFGLKCLASSAQYYRVCSLWLDVIPWIYSQNSWVYAYIWGLRISVLGWVQRTMMRFIQWQHTDTNNYATDLFFLFFVCQLGSTQYKVKPDSLATHIQTEWLVNLMYATVASCSACHRSRLSLVRDHNEAIFLTNLCMCWSNEAFELRSYCTSAQLLMQQRLILAQLLSSTPAETSTHSLNY